MTCSFVVSNRQRRPRRLPLSLIPRTKAPSQPIKDFRRSVSTFLPSLRHARRVLSSLKPTSTALTANTDASPVEIICDIFRHATRLPPLNCDEPSSKSAWTHCSLSPVRMAAAALLPLRTPPYGLTFSLTSCPGPVFCVCTSNVPPVCIST